MLDREGQILRINSSWSDAIYYATDELIGRRLDSLVGESQRAWFRTILDDVAAGEECGELELQVVGKDGSFHWLLCNLAGSESGESISFQAQDITLRKWSEQSVRRSEAMISALINNLPATIYVREAGGRYILANREFERRHQLPPGGAIGLTPADLYPEDIAAEFLAEDRAVMDSGETLLAEKDIPFAVGTLTVLSAKFPVTGSDGSVSGIGVVSTDITERRRSEQALAHSETMLRTLSANLPAMVYQFKVAPDGTRSFPYVSDRVSDLFAISPAQATADAQALFACVDPEDVPAVEQSTRQSLETMSQWVCEFRLRDRGLGVSWMRGAAIPRKLPDGSVIWDGVISDVTELKTFQREMAQARDAAQKADKAKSEFLSRMSHELRTPMNAVLGFGQLVLDYADPLTERQREYIGHILSGGRHLLELIDDVLDLAKIETGNIAMQIVPVQVEGVVRECLAIVNTMVEHFKVKLEPQPDIPDSLRVLADRVRLRQVLLNLLSNAVKYNRRGGSVRLECTAIGSRLRISVIDTGLGIAADKHARLFESFNRLGAEGTDIEGTGIGLTIARTLVERMGGAIGFHSVVGEGTSFWIDLPVAGSLASHGVEAASDMLAPAGVQPLRVLYVEDNAANMVLMRAVLEHGGYKVQTATTGEQGLRQALADPPDVVLLDINLPGMDGFAVLTALRDAPSTRDLVVIAVSAAALPSDLARAKAAGFDDYIVKPISVNQLGPSIQAAWRARKAMAGALS